MIKIRNLVFICLAVLLIFVSGCSKQQDVSSGLNTDDIEQDSSSVSGQENVAEVVEEDLIDSEEDDVEIGSLI